MRDRVGRPSVLGFISLAAGLVACGSPPTPAGQESPADTTGAATPGSSTTPSGAGDTGTAAEADVDGATGSETGAAPEPQTGTGTDTGSDTGSETGSETEGDAELVPLPYVSAGDFASCVIDTSNAMQCWGIDDASTTDGGIVRDAPADGQFAFVDVGRYHACAIDVMGALQCWGADPATGWDYGQVSETPAGGSWLRVSAGSVHTCAITDAGDIQCWGLSEDMVPSPLWWYGQTTDYPTEGGPFTEIVAGERSSATRSASGVVTLWGPADGSMFDHGLVTDAPPTGDDAAVALSGAQACTLSSAGEVACWGADIYDAVNEAPVSAEWKALSGGNNGANFCAIDTADGLTCWGWDRNDLTSPPIATAAQIECGRDHFCAIDLAGALHCWGDDTHGQVSNTPVL